MFFGNKRIYNYRFLCYKRIILNLLHSRRKKTSVNFCFHGVFFICSIYSIYILSIYKQNYKHQSIGFFCTEIKYVFTCEKCLHQRNPLCELNGDGCAASKIKCLELSINPFLLCANAPHRRKTTCCCSSEIVRITASVNCCHPIAWCDPGSPALTVSIALSNNTHCSAHLDKFPDVGIVHQISVESSLKIFCRLGGFFTQSGTEKLNPCACQAPW